MKKLIIVLTVILLTTGIGFAGQVQNKYQEPPPYMELRSSIYFLTTVNKQKVGIIKTTAGINNTYDDFINATSYFKRFNVKYVIVYLNSPGGSVFEGLATAQYMRELERKGWVFEIRCNGWAASAASLILAAGTPGKRYMSKYAFLMVHELSVFEFFSYKNVSDKEKEAETLRRIQNVLNSFIAVCTGKPLKFIDRIVKEETWVTAETAIKFGFCDHIIE